MEGCAGGRARALNLQCAGSHVDKMGLPDGTALELKALLESLRASVHTGGQEADGAVCAVGNTKHKQMLIAHSLHRDTCTSSTSFTP